MHIIKGGDHSFHGLEEWIRRYGMDNCISADDVLTYLKAPTYENDLFDISSILNNREDVYFCHLEAIEGEMERARRMGDEAWVEKRVRDLHSYLDDPYLPEGLRKRVIYLISKYQER